MAGILFKQRAGTFGRIIACSRRGCPSLGRIFAGFSIVGLVVLGYLFGAAVVYFDLPSAHFMEKGFSGAVAWHEREFPADISPYKSPENLTSIIVTDDVPGQTFDGFTLYTTTQNATATLIDMQGNVVHDWALPFSKAFPKAPHLRAPLEDDRIHWFRCHLYPNGDLLAIYHAEGDTPYGYGMVKLDRNSRLLWAYASCVHHDLDVADDGTIYALTHKFSDRPILGSASVPSIYLADFVVALSPEGIEQKQISIIDAFGGTPFEAWLGALDAPRLKAHLPEAEPTVRPMISPDGLTGLAATQARHPYGRSAARQQRQGSRTKTRGSFSVVPGRTGSRIAAQLEYAGRAGCRNFFRRLGRPRTVAKPARCGVSRQRATVRLRQSRIAGADLRVLEYDPRTQTVPWCYENEDSEPFVASLRGTKQRLANGNTLIVDPDSGRIVEVTAAKKRVWECICPVHVKDRPGDSSIRAKLTGARRYDAADLPFLGGKTPARP